MKVIELTGVESKSAPILSFVFCPFSYRPSVGSFKAPLTYTYI